MSTKSRCVVHSSVLLILLSLSPAFASAAGIQNPGFESGMTPWITPSTADAAVVVGTEGPTDFQTYADLGITVNPYIGQSMLRLGTPKQDAEKQNRGDNIAYQVFTPDKDTLKFAARLFSWEHRGDDSVVISLKEAVDDGSGNLIPGADVPEHIGVDMTDKDGNSAYFALGSNGDVTCDHLPCNFNMDVGKSGDFINTGWVEFKLSGLSALNRRVILEYDVIGGQNESHATWAYFDNTNTPPVAKFNFTSGAITEGDFVTFNDKSYDPDAPGDKIVSWVWHVDGPGLNNTVDIKEQNPSILFPSVGPYTVTLTVTDTHGASTSVSTGGFTTDPVPEQIPDISVENGAPLTGVLNQQVLAGKPFDVIGRFLDPGFLDTHSFSWWITGSDANPSSASDVAVDEINDASHAPFVGTGVIADTAKAPNTPGTYTGSLQVTDNFGESSQAKFTLDVLDPNYSDPREGDTDVCPAPPTTANSGNNCVATAPVLVSGWSYLTSLDHVGDKDIFEIKLPPSPSDSGPQPIPAGSEIMVKLKNLPLDADLILLSKLPDSLNSTAWGRFAWGRFAWGRFAWGRFAWGRFPYTDAAWGRFPYADSAWGRFAWGRFDYSTMAWGRFPYSDTAWGRFPWSDTNWYNEGIANPIGTFPLSEMANLLSSGPGDIGNGDINLSELGLDPDEFAGMTVVGYSANRGLDDEQLLIRTDYPGTKIYAVVLANNGMASTEPFSIQIEASTPPKLEDMGGSVCDARTVAVASSEHAIDTGVPAGDVETLIVTQTERIAALNPGMDKKAFEAKLVALADNGNVNGEIIDLPTSIYDGWDSKPCDINEVNTLSQQIRSVISEKLQSGNYPNLKYVVFVGDDDIVPYRRVPDETVISNERLYVPESYIKKGPIYASLWKGYNLTDDYYTDSKPEPFQGRELYVPDIASGRLVETPGQIMSLIQDFLDSNGELPTSSALVSGYDFFTDGSNLTKSYLSSLVGGSYVTDLINGTWDASQLRCDFLGLGDVSAGCGIHSINSVNAHFNHFQGLPALSYYMQNYDDFLSSIDVANAKTGNGAPALKNTLNYTIGCHAGLSVPDGTTYSTDLFGGKADPNLDFPEAMAIQDAVFIGNTGYGLGDDAGIAGSELLMSDFSEELLAGGDIGTILMNTKQKFVKSVNVMDVYSEKSSIQTTLYGLPMWKIVSSAAPTPLPAVTNLTIVDGGNTSYKGYVLNKVSVGPLAGSSNDRAYYTANDGSQVTAWRPIEPKTVFDVTDTANPVHGVLVTGGTYDDGDQNNPFYPVISKPRQEWAKQDNENPACLNAFWPSMPASINTFDGATDVSQSLIVMPGQFLCTSGEVADIYGTQRLFNTLKVELLRSNADNHDYTLPTISEVNLRDNNDGTISVKVNATDDSGIARIVLLLIQGGQITPISNYSTVGPDSYAINNIPYSTGARVVIQVADLAGNVATWAGKGVNVRVIKVDAGDSQLYSTQTPTTLKGTIPDFDKILAESPSMFYRWEFGDGTYAFGRLAKDGTRELDTSGVPIVNPDGSFTVDHLYSSTSNVTAELKITDAIGGVGVDDVKMIFCGDGNSRDLSPDYGYLDYKGCDVDNSSTEVTLYVTTWDPISDTSQYRINLDIQSSPHNPVPDGKSDIMLKYQGGSATGLQSLVVTPIVSQVDGKIHTLKFDFDLYKDLGWTGTYFDWNAETQDGVAGKKSAGFNDVMPDTGMFRYFMH